MTGEIIPMDKKCGDDGRPCLWESCIVICVSPDDKYYFIYDSDGGRILSTDDNKVIFRLNQSLYPIDQLGISHDNSVLFSYSLYNGGIIWDLSQNKIVKKTLSAGDFWAEYYSYHKIDETRNSIIARFEKDCKETVLSKYRKCGNYGIQGNENILYISHNKENEQYSLVIFNLMSRELEIMQLHGLSGTYIEDTVFTSDATLAYVGTDTGIILVIRLFDGKVINTTISYKFRLCKIMPVYEN